MKQKEKKKTNGIIITWATLSMFLSKTPIKKPATEIAKMAVHASELNPSKRLAGKCELWLWSSCPGTTLPRTVSQRTKEARFKIVPAK